MTKIAPSLIREPYHLRAKKWLKERERAKYTAVLQFFLLGSDFTLVTATLPFYLKELHASNIPVLFGIITATYALAATISGLVFGRIVDVTLRYKAVVITTNVIASFGNVLYIIGYSPYLLVFARFLTGCIDSIHAATYGELARCYTVKEFPRHGGHLMTAYCVGLCISPGFNMMPSDMVLDLGFITIRYTNAPGLILFLLGFIQILLSCFFVTNVSLNKQRNGLDVNDLYEDQLITLTAASKKVSYNNFSSTESSHERSITNDVVIIASPKPWWKVVLEFIKTREILILVYGQVIWAYSLISGINLMPLIAINYLNFSHRQVALYFIGSGVSTSIVMFLSSRLIAKYGSARTSLAAFIINFVGTLFLYLVVLAERLPFPIKVTFFIIFGVTYFLAWFLNSVSLKATLSKHVAMEDQSFSQGVYTLVEQVVSIFAGLIAGILYAVVTWYCLWSAGLLLIAIFIFAAFYNELEYPVLYTSDEI